VHIPAAPILAPACLGSDGIQLGIGGLDAAVDHWGAEVACLGDHHGGWKRCPPEATAVILQNPASVGREAETHGIGAIFRIADLSFSAE
jgi:hypothetical protein